VTLDEAHRNASGCERSRIIEPVVAKHVGAGHRDHGRRHAREIAGRQRGELAVVHAGAGAIRFPVPSHMRRREIVPRGELAVRTARAARIERRTEQERVGLRCARSLEPQREHRGEVAAGAVARNDETPAIGAERGRLFAHPVPGGFDVVERGRIGVLRRSAIIHRNDDRAQRVGENAAELVVRIEGARDPSAAVGEERERQRGRTVGTIDPRCHPASGHGRVAHRGHAFHRFAAHG